MRSIRMVTVGKIKQSSKYLEAGIALYQKRLGRYAKVDWIEVPEETPTPTRPVAQILDREAESLLKHCPAGEIIVLLNERGNRFNSTDFAVWLFGGNPLNGGRPQEPSDPIIFIIGGAFGTSEKLVERASQVISLSPMTFPHQMTRLILIEQLYRAYTIAYNEPYHK
jgi:23S rRNA (pseudouridine1915-N3)-methyltransferase